MEKKITLDMVEKDTKPATLKIFGH